MTLKQLLKKQRRELGRDYENIFEVAIHAATHGWLQEGWFQDSIANSQKELIQI